MPSESADRAFLIVGVVVIVALLCFTVLAAIGADGTGTMRDILLGLVALLSGAYAIYRHTNGKGGNDGTTGSQ